MFVFTHKLKDDDGDPLSIDVRVWVDEFGQFEDWLAFIEIDGEECSICSRLTPAESGEIDEKARRQIAEHIADAEGERRLDRERGK